MKHVLVPLATGFEEIEAITVIDILRRAGMTVTVAGDARPDGTIPGRTDIKVAPDCSLDDIAASDSADFDVVVLPGGLGGTERLQRDERVKRILKHIDANNGITAAICAAPTILAAFGLLHGKTVTSHPTVKDKLGEAMYKDERVVVDGRLITSQGPGTAMEFALALVEHLEGKEKMLEVNEGVLARL
ncbi:MAG TPA: DJ-1/PfpI family protein [Nitrospirales bacterium]|nr:DJ-1/PfpI family protein [Nitrospirales bacterium]HIO21135.1 DJ-1/PfpI family protein [Nitrospirales bacterium]